MHTTCPLCKSDVAVPWAQENGFAMGKCQQCGLLYVDPRPSDDEINDANKVGVHRGEDGALDVRSHYRASKTRQYAAIIRKLFGHDWSEGKPISWFDVGAGYGEVVAAVQQVAPAGSTVCGIEPMQPKVERAQSLGLPVSSRLLKDMTGPYDVISLINVYSHVPDFLSFGAELVAKLRPGGVLFVETGNIADLANREQFADKLYLPDHLVFSGPGQMRRTFEQIGLVLESKDERAVDSLLWCAKVAVRNALRGRISVPLPWHSKFRTVFYKARRPLTRHA